MIVCNVPISSYFCFFSFTGRGTLPCQIIISAKKRIRNETRVRITGKNCETFQQSTYDLYDHLCNFLISFLRTGIIYLSRSALLSLLIQKLMLKLIYDLSIEYSPYFSPLLCGKQPFVRIIFQYTLISRLRSFSIEYCAAYDTRVIRELAITSSINYCLSSICKRRNSIIE